jgi:polar amino acid transport system substrate-binding protein
MTIQQAMGIPRSRPEAAQVLLQRFMMDALKSGLIHQLIEKHKINGANVYEAF